MESTADKLAREYGVSQSAAELALLKRNGIEAFAREFLEVSEKIKSGKLRGVVSDYDLFPLWGEYLKKQNG